MDDTAIARAVHVLAVVLWIGGLGFVTTVLLPAIRLLKPPEERVACFDVFERRFSWQAQITTGLTGVSGVYMLVRFDLWDRFRAAGFWWMHAMVFVWLLFTVVLFVVEPLFLHRWLDARAREKPEAAFRLIEWAHWLLFLVSIIAILGAVAGSQGLMI
jgi:uncharacterized membrane protein